MGDRAAVVDLDHVTTVLDLAGARQLFSALERLGLASVWPFAEYPGFATGAARLGNVTLESIGVDGAAAAGWPAQFLTLAPPGLEGLEDELDRRGIRHGPPEPFIRRPGEEPLFTTVSLPDLGGPSFAVQLCAFATPPQADAAPSSDRAGVVGVERVVVGARDIAHATQVWSTLLEPLEPAADCVWRPPTGPAIELRSADQDTLIEMVLAVRSLPEAREALAAAGLAVENDIAQLGTLTTRIVDSATDGTSA